MTKITDVSKSIDNWQVFKKKKFQNTTEAKWLTPEKYSTIPTILHYNQFSRGGGRGLSNISGGSEFSRVQGRGYR